MKHAHIIRSVALLLATLMVVLSMAACTGPQGEPGVQGEPGIQGEQGLPGKDGNDGKDGEKGEPGESGATGAQGEKGDKGDTGATGAQGEKGDKGDTGAAGLQGEKGDKGDTGATGPKGDKGDTGATGAAGKPGANGREVVFRVHNGWMQWQYQGDSTWTDLFEVPTVEEQPKLTLFVNGGVLPSGALTEISATAGTTVQLPTPTKEGSVFLGWFTDGGTAAVSTNYTIQKSEILVAAWGDASYTLSFDKTSAGKDIPSQTYTYGNTVTLPKVEKAGYTFNGWCTKSDLSDTPILTLPQSFYGNKTLYAKFTPNTYAVSIHVDGFTVSQTKVDVVYGKSFQLPVPTKANYTFAGWYNQQTGGNIVADSTGKSVAAYATVGNQTVYARWETRKYQVSYNTAGGTAIAPASYAYGTKLTTFPEAVKTGYLFEGWYLNSGLTQACPAELTVDKDIVLYAKYRQSKAIATVDDLKSIAVNPSANYHLVADINLDGGEWTPIAEFNGNLDGQGHKVHNFTMSGSGSSFGFFNSNNGTIQNLTLTDFSMTISTSSVQYSAGAICGINNGTIKECKITDGVASFAYYHQADTGYYSSKCGGIVGTNNGSIWDCEIAININSSVSCGNYNTRYPDTYMDTIICIGSITGLNGAEGTIQRCQIQVEIQSSTGPAVTGGHRYAHSTVITEIGGAVSCNMGIISDISCQADIIIDFVSGNQITAADIGGFVCLNTGTISNSYASGSITDKNGGATTLRSAGFVDRNYNTINNCYTSFIQDTNTTGREDSRNAGFVYENSKTITNCYALGSIENYAIGGNGSFVSLNKAGGVISKSFSSVTLKANSSVTPTGSFVVHADGGSSIYKCYFDENMGITVGGVVATPTNQDGIPAKLEDFYGNSIVVDKLSWPTDIWYISDTALPILQWQKN